MDLDVERKNSQELERVRVESQRLREEEEKKKKAASELVVSSEAQGNKKTPEENQHDRISIVIFIFLLILCIAADAAELVTGGTIGEIAGIAVDFILFIFFWFRGEKAGDARGFLERYKGLFAMIGVETIPFLNTLPVRTIYMIWYQWKGQSQKDIINE
jgi:hypothetical protein